MNATTWLFLPLWALCGAYAGMLVTAWSLLVGPGPWGVVTAWSVALGTASGGWLLGGTARRVVHPMGRLPPLFMTLAALMAVTASLHAALRVAPSVDLLHAARTTAHLCLAAASVLLGALLPVVVRVAEPRRDGPRVATLLAVLSLLLGTLTGAEGVTAVWSNVDSLQLLLALSLCGALCGMLCRRAALVLTNAPAPPTRYQVTNAPPPAPPRHVVPRAPLVGAAFVVGSLLIWQAPCWLLAAPLLSLWLQARHVHPLDAGREAAWMQAASACGAALATAFFQGAAR